MEEEVKKPKKFIWKRVFILLILAIIGGGFYLYISFGLGPNPFLGGFCGSSEGTCESESDCFATGCSGQICSNEAVMTTCEWRDCYDDDARGLHCACYKGKCKWKKK